MWVKWSIRHIIFSKKNRTLSFWPSMLPHKVVLPQTQNLPVSNSARSQSASAYNKIDASESIIHIDASWRDGDSNGDMVFRLEKKSQWVCDVLPFCAHFLPHTRRNWAILLQRFGANFGHSQVNGSTDTLSRMDERSSLKTWGLLDVDNRCGHVALVHQVLLVLHDVWVESLQLEQ